MATYVELEAYGIVGSAVVLPVPVGPEPQPLSGPICSQAEARAAGLDIAPSVEELDAMASTIVAAGDPLSAEVSLAQAVPLLGAAVVGLRARVAELKAARADEHDELALALGRNNGTEWGDLIEYAAGAVSVEAKLRVRVAELVAERHSTNEALSDAAEQLRADRDRIAALEATPKTVFRASHDSIVMGLYTTREAARDHCHKLMERASAATLEWRPDGERREDDDGEPGPDEAEELYEYGTHESATWDPTGYVVTPVEVASEYDEEADE